MARRSVGLLRLTTLPYAAHAILAPTLPRFLIDHPAVSVEVVVDDRLTDVVAAGFDAGIRFGETVERDMVAVRAGPGPSGGEAAQAALQGVEIAPAVGHRAAEGARTDCGECRARQAVGADEVVVLGRKRMRSWRGQGRLMQLILADEDGDAGAIEGFTGADSDFTTLLSRRLVGTFDPELVAFLRHRGPERLLG